MIVEEGKVKIIAPTVNEKGPGKIKGVFYNREMIFNRDSTIFLLYNIKVKNALDALAATGVRGIRIVREIGIPVTINDFSKEAYKIIKKNAELNNVQAEILNMNANSLMSIRRFDYVDIDPFGTPVPFIDIALRSGKILGITATDTATLSGRRKKVERRYLAKVVKGSGNHEIGIRILLGYVGRMAARFDIGIEPIFSFWKGHAYRIYIRVKKGVKYAMRTLEKIKTTEFGGPLWIADIHDLEFLKHAKIPDIQTRKEFEKYLQLWRNEKFFLYYEIPQICSSLKISQPPISKIIDSLREIGYEAYRTHFSPQGIRVNATLGELKKLLKSLSKSS